MEFVEIKAEKYIISGKCKFIITLDELAENPLCLNDVGFLSCHNKFCSVDAGKEYEKLLEYLSLPQVIKSIRNDGYIVTPVYAYIHSGVALSLDYNGSKCNFDRGLLGLLLYKSELTAKEVREIVMRWECYINSTVYAVDVINVQNGSLEDSHGDLYDTEGVQDLLKQYGINISSMDILELLQHNQ